MNNAEMLIKKEIIKIANEWNSEVVIPDDCDIVNFYDDNKYEYDELVDATEEFRCAGIDTNLSCESSRYYESERVARSIDGIWVSWIYWHGGGKHGEPEAIDWIEPAIIVDCTEEEVTTIKRTFSNK